MPGEREPKNYREVPSNVPKKEEKSGEEIFANLDKSVAEIVRLKHVQEWESEMGKLGSFDLYMEWLKQFEGYTREELVEVAKVAPGFEKNRKGYEAWLIAKEGSKHSDSIH